MNGSWTHRPYGNLGLHRKALLAVAALCAFFAIGTPTAFGAYVQLGTFANGGLAPGGSGGGDGEIRGFHQADVNDATGKLYVADTLNDRVEVFRPTATGGEYDTHGVLFAAAFGVAGLAIDQATGDVYVSNPNGISKLDEDLNEDASGWTDPGVGGPLAVDPSTGDLLVADTDGGLIRRFESDGTPVGTFEADRPVDLAVNSSGEVFVVTTTGSISSGPCGATSAVERFSSTGVSAGTLAGLVIPGAVDIDRDDDSIVVATHVNEYFCELGNLPRISFLDPSGALQETVILGADTMYAAVPGLAAQGGGSSRVYALTRSPVNDGFGATKATLLGIPTPEEPQIVRQSALRGDDTATLRATINPKHLATDYYFEYGRTAAYGEETPVGSLPVDGVDHPVEVEVTGLEPGTTYHYRVVAENSLGVVQGGDRTFTTTESGSASCPNASLRTGASAHLTDCRAFELVTPSGSDADIRITGAPISSDGRIACFNTEDPLLDADPSGIKTTDQGFCAWRTAAGWETKWVTVPPGRSASPRVARTSTGSLRTVSACSSPPIRSCSATTTFRLRDRPTAVR